LIATFHTGKLAKKRIGYDRMGTSLKGRGNSLQAFQVITIEAQQAEKKDNCIESPCRSHEGQHATRLCCLGKILRQSIFDISSDGDLCKIDVHEAMMRNT